MKRQLSTIALGLALLGSFMGYSQDKIQPCNTYEVMEEYFKNNPGARQQYNAEQAKLQQSYLQAEQNNSSNKLAAVQLTVPVIFHVLHLGGAENISDAQCISALNQVNSDFARAGSDTGSIFAPFKSLYINSDIKFMLAKKDPNGNCINGVRHLYDTRADWSQGSAGASQTYYNGITWDPSKYLNIIIVKQIVPTGTVTGGGIIVGYTYKPGSFGTGNLRDAIVYNYGFLSGINARSLSHEIGHWLNLAHTFGNTNNPGVQCGSVAGGDGISDTPDTKGNFSACPLSSTNTAYTCTSPNPGNSANYYQNVENIMDYSSCPKNFTAGQTTAMRNALQSTTSGRSNLITTANHTATDINGSGVCAPIADFLTTNNSYTVCSGGSLTLKDYSYNGTVTSYSWTGTSGVTFASPSASLTAATFATPGVATITLTVANGNGSNAKVKTITVLNAGVAVVTPYAESFEGATLPSGWSISNPNSNVTWAQTNIASSSGAYSYFIDGTINPGGQTDILYMPTIDILNNPSDTFTFKYAYRRYSTSNNDIFKVEASKDCGGTWASIFSPSAANLAAPSGGVGTAPFSPSPSQWVHINLTNYPNWFNYTNSASVMLRFSFTESLNSSGGNNFYLDDINFSSGGPVGMKELSKSVSFGLFPNPASGAATVKFRLHDPATVKVEVIDIVGKTVIPATETEFTAGEQNVIVNKNQSLANGVYFVNLSVNGVKMTKKLIIE